MLLNTGADFTMISQLFDNQYELSCISSKVRSIYLVNLGTLLINWDVTSFLLRLEKLQTGFLGAIMPGLNHNVITKMD